MDWNIVGRGCHKGEYWSAYIHNVVIDNEGRAFCLLFVAYTDLTKAAIPAKQIIQIFPCDLVVEIFYKKDPIGTRWKLSLFESEFISARRVKQRGSRLTAGLARAMMFRTNNWQRPTMLVEVLSWGIIVLPYLSGPLHPHAIFGLCGSSKLCPIQCRIHVPEGKWWEKQFRRVLRSLIIYELSSTNTINHIR